MLFRDVHTKTKSSFPPVFDALLIASIVLSSFLLVTPVRAEMSERTLQDSLHLMAVSQTILAGEIDDELEYSKLNGAMAPDSKPLNASVEEQLLVAMINSVKSQISTLIKECNETRRKLVEREEECAVSTLDNICEEGKRELRNTLSLLHQVRGDKRKFFTRVGASLKRAGKSIWRAVGPVGRRILRTLGDEVVQAVKTPGGIKVRALRVIIRSRLKTLARKEIRSAIQRGAERLIMKKWEVARGPTGDQCLEGGVAPESQEEPTYGDEDWFDEVWGDIEAALVVGRQNCQKTAISKLRGCLLDHAASGASAEDAINECEPLFNAIPKNDAGGSVTMTGEVNHGGTVANEFSLTYPSDGGAVTGGFYYQIYDDIGQCTITVTTSGVTGQYDPATCSMSGTARMTLNHDGMLCVSVCGPTDASPAPCPVTIEGPTIWDATLEDGVLIGGVGGEECKPHCFGFRAPGYGLSP